MIAKAFVLGAGLGMRLRPLTEEVPKPLVPIFQKPLITFSLDHLAALGVQSFVINTHHLPEHFERFFSGGCYRNLPVELVHEPVLLETGGGIKNAQPLLGNEPFISYSGDVLTDLPLAPLIDEHFRSGNDVTLALRDTGIASNVAFRDGRVVDIGRRYGYEGNHDYANVAVWNAAIFEKIPPNIKISFIPIVAEWIGAGGRVGGVVLNQGRWFNLGSPKEYLEVHSTIAEGWRPDYVSDPEWPLRIAADATIDPTAEIRGCSAIGAGCQVAAGSLIEDSILWPGAQIASHSRLTDCIIRTGRRAEGALRETVI